MKTKKLLSTLSSTAMGWLLLPARAITISSRSRRKPEREADVNRRVRAKAAVAVYLLISMCGVLITMAKPTRRTRPITSQYSLDKSVAETDGPEIRRKLGLLLSRPDIQMFLRVIQRAEAGEPNLMVGGCRARTLSRHLAYTLPRRCWYPVRIRGHWRYSTASGNYQITLSNWKEIARFLGLRNFNVTSQQLAALELIRRGGGAQGAHTPRANALKARIQNGFRRLVEGRIKLALCLATYDWASSSCSSLPGRKISYAALYDKMRRVDRELVRLAHHLIKRRTP